MDRFYMSDNFDLNVQLHAFLGEQYEEEQSVVSWQCNKAANYYLQVWNMKKAASMDLDLNSMNHLQALRVALGSRL